MARVWSFLVAACLLPAAAQADELDFSGTVGRIFDGDSFLVRPGKGRDVDVRLQDIDAPEKSQPYGNNARAALVKLIADRSVFVDVVDTDRYGRKVVRVYRQPDRLDVVKAMVREGHVWVYRRTVHDRSLIELEDAARASRRGLWALPENDRLPPWQYRYLQRQKPKRSSRVALGPVNTHLVGCVAPPIACSKAQSAALMSIRASFATQRQAIRGATHLMNKYPLMGRAIAVQDGVTPPLVYGEYTAVVAPSPEPQ